MEGSAEMANIMDLAGLKVRHLTKVSWKKPFGVGTISEVLSVNEGNAKLKVLFEEEKETKSKGKKKTTKSVSKSVSDSTEVKKETVEKLFSYPSCFIDFLEFIDEVSDDIEEMIDCDIEAYKERERLEQEELHRLALAKAVKQKEFNCIALKRPYVDGVYSCTSTQMKNNVNSKYTFCQNSNCKACMAGEMSYDDLSKEYNDAGGCAELLIPSTYNLHMSLRNKVEKGDVIIFTCIPKDSKEQDRFVYGCGVVDTVSNKETYNDVTLDEGLSYFVDYDLASNNKFWDVMLNLNKPGVMLFGNSHCRKIKDNQQVAQFIRMLFTDEHYKDVDDDELQAKYETLLNYVGINAEDIEENKGALVLAAKEESKNKKKDKKAAAKEEEVSDEDYSEDYEDDDTDTEDVKEKKVADSDDFSYIEDDEE